MVRPTVVAALVAVLALVAGVLPSTAAAPSFTAAPSGVTLSAAAAPSDVTRTYAPTDEPVANPDRGMYRYSGTHYRADGSGHEPLDPAQLLRRRQEDGTTLVYRVFYLERFVDRATVDAAYLDLVEADLAAARAAGVKVIVRFAYSETSSRDATPALAQGHVRQLAPVLNRNADVVAVVQAGFVGRWGEWYYSDSFASDPSRPWALTDADWQARRDLLLTLLDATEPGVFVQVRYPGIKQRLLPPSDPRAARVGIHNDCFLASPDDHGTFPQTGDREWLAEQTRSVPMGGETCEVNEPRSRWESAETDLRAYHWTYLNADYHRDVLASWGGGLQVAEQRLGYRLRLVDATLPERAGTGEVVPVTLRLTNDGFAAPFRSRPVRLVLRQGTTVREAVVPLDVRTLAPGRTVEVTVPVTAPDVTGAWSVHLALPDPHPRSAAASAYAVRLANQGTWDATTGTNDLGHTITVQTAPVPTPTPAPTPTPTPVPPAVAPVRVSSLPLRAVSSGWGPVERDRSNGEQAAGDGRPLSLRGRTFDHGLGVHSASSVTVDLRRAYRTFSATVGVDDEVAGRGSVRFAVYVDGRRVARTAVLTGGSAPVRVEVPVTGASTLRLVVTDAGDGTAYDHADWATAELVRR